MSDISNDDIVKLYEEIINHLKYLQSSILTIEEETSDNNEWYIKR